MKPYFGHHKKSPEILRQAREQYPWMIKKGLSDESIEARHYLLGYLKQEFGYEGFLPKTEQGIPMAIQPKDGESLLYWSVSHSQEYVAYIVSDHPTGIDILEYRERDSSLFGVHQDSEYDRLGGKNWYNFYLLWTAKESIIKASLGILDDMQYISLQDKFSKNSYLFAYRDQVYRISSNFSDGLFLSHIIS